MKFLHTIFSLAFVIAAPVLADSGYSFAVTRESKKLDGERKEKSVTMQTKDVWAYKVTLENKSFKDADNVEIKYLVFMKPDAAGERTRDEKLVRKEGSIKVPSIKNFEKYTFTTEPVTLTGVKLQPGWSYTSGANARAKDSMSGLWLRIFVNGQQVMEDINPTWLKTKETWDAK